MKRIKKKRARYERIDLPAYISTGQRIRKMVETGVVDFIPTPAVYDDQPDHPSKSMEVDFTKQVCQDPFDMAERLGDVATKAIEKQAVKQSSQAKPEGVQHSEQSEV